MIGIPKSPACGQHVLPDGSLQFRKLRGKSIAHIGYFDILDGNICILYGIPVASRPRVLHASFKPFAEPGHADADNRYLSHLILLPDYFFAGLN